MPEACGKSLLLMTPHAVFEGHGGIQLGCFPLAALVEQACYAGHEGELLQMVLHRHEPCLLHCNVPGPAGVMVAQVL